MKHCFEDYKINCTKEYIVIKKLMQVENYESLTIYVMKTRAPKTILFFRIMYVLDFPINFIFMNKIKLKEVYWDNLNNKLIKKINSFTM